MIHRTKTTTILRSYWKLKPTTENQIANDRLKEAQRCLAEALVVLLQVPSNSHTSMTVDGREYTIHHGMNDCWVQHA